MHRTLTLAALIVAVAAQAHATSSTKPDGPRPDANGDGVVTREEANAFPRLAGHFDAVAGFGQNRREIPSYRVSANPLERRHPSCTTEYV